jgi:hypothetical protein
MPTIRDLDRFGQCLGDRLTVSAAAIARHHTDAGPRRKPGFNGGGLAVGQNIDNAMPLKIADDRSIAMPTLPRLVIDPNVTGRFGPPFDEGLGLRSCVVKDVVSDVA